MKPAVVQGSYADLKIIKSRSVVQVIVECPIERFPEIVEAFGGPLPGNEVPVVIARMANGYQEPPEEEEKPRRPFNTLPVAQQAALACGDPVFRAWLREEMNAPQATDEGQAAAWLRSWFRVDSRAQITEAQWEDLYPRFLAWKAAEAVL